MRLRISFGVPDQALKRWRRQSAVLNNRPYRRIACWDYSLEEIMNNRVIQQPVCLALTALPMPVIWLNTMRRCWTAGRGRMSLGDAPAARTMSLAPADRSHLQRRGRVWTGLCRRRRMSRASPVSLAQRLWRLQRRGGRPGSSTLALPPNLMRGGATHRQEIIDMVKRQCRKN